MERKGICKNIGVCTKVDKVQIIHEDADFVCSECGSSLEEYVEEKPHPGKKTKMKLLILIIVAAIIIVAIVSWLILKPSPNPEPDEKTQIKTVEEKQESGVITETVTVTVTETVTEIVPAPSKPIANSGGTLSLSYGTYKGATKRGYAHGQGRLTYKTDRIINRNDPKQRKAKAGDYIIGEFYNGFVVYGKHYNALGELIESLTFGVASEDSYELK